jgi:uncharacterized protein YodC (DUF2158 family)
MIAKPHFAEREVVRLVAGGPAMVVEGPCEIKGRVWCTWSIGRFYHGGSFEECVLVRVDISAEESRDEVCDNRYHTPIAEMREVAVA